MKKTKAMFVGVLVIAMTLVPLNSLLAESFMENVHSAYTIERGEFHPHPVVCKVTEKIGAPEPVPPPLGTDSPIADSSDNEVSPSVALCSGENIIAAFALQPDVLTSGILFSYSTDMGSTWNLYERQIEDMYDTDPSVAYRGTGNSAVACWTLGEYEAGNVVYLMPDITDPETYGGSLWAWEDNYGFFNWHNFTIAGYYSDDYPEFWGMMSFIGDSDDENIHYFATECPWILTDGTKWYGEGYAVCDAFLWWNYSRTTSISIDQSTGRGYTVFDFFNSSVGTYSLGIINHPTERVWDDDSVWYWTNISGGFFASYAHPDVSVSSGSGYIVCETNENGNKDIICFHSTDGFNTTTKTFVANSPDDETDPSIVSYGNIAQCTFIKNGNIYETHTSDGGATWSEPLQINDQDGTVASGWHASQLTTGGNIIWTDTRNGNNDIYFDSLGVPAPVINIEEIKGGFGVKATVTNTGGGDAENVDWTITFSGPVFIGKEKGGTVTIPAGGTATISSGLVFGIGPASVTVTVGGATKKASCFVLGPLVLGVK